MAINKGKNQPAQSNQQREKAAGFLNWELPTRDGKTTRLQSLPLLTESDPVHKQLFDYLTGADTKGGIDDDEKAKRLANVAGRLVLTVGVNRSDEDKQLVL